MANQHTTTYGQQPNTIVDITTFFTIGDSLRDLDRLVNSFGRTLTDNERRLQQTLPGMIKTFQRVEKEFKASGKGKLTGDQAADLKVMLANEQNILKWLNQLSKFNPKTGLSKNQRNDQSFLQYAHILEDVMNKLSASMERAYKQWASYNKTVANARARYNLIPPVQATQTNAQQPSAQPQGPPKSALSRPFNFTSIQSDADDTISAIEFLFTDFFQNLHKTFKSVLVIHNFTGQLKTMSDSYKGGLALQGSMGDLQKLHDQFKDRYEEIDRLQKFQQSVANAGAQLRAQFPGYNFTNPTTSNIAQPSKGKLLKQSLGKGASKVGMVATKVAGIALKAIPIVGAIATGVSLIFKTLKKHSPVLQAVTDIMQLAWSLLWMPLGNALGQALLPMAEWMINFAIAFNRLFSDFSLENLAQFFYSAMQMMWGPLSQLINALPKFLIDHWLQSASDFFRAVGLDGVADFFDKAREFYDNGLDWITNFPTHMSDFVTDLITKLKAALKDIFNLGDSAKEISNAYDQAKSGNWGEAAKSAIKATPGGKILSKVGILGTGGIVTRPSLNVIGEAGPEAVIPLDKASGFGATYVININGDVYGVSDLESRIERVIQRTANKSYYR